MKMMILITVKNLHIGMMLTLIVLQNIRTRKDMMMITMKMVIIARLNPVGMMNRMTVLM